jgi:hypothetical protein
MSWPVANATNTFFLTITVGLKLQQMRNEDAVSFLKYAFPVKFPDMKIIPTSESEIKSIIHSLKLKKLIRL